MFERLARGLRYTATLLAAVRVKPRRALLGRMVTFSRGLPRQFDQPLPEMLAQLTPGEWVNGRVGESVPLDESIRVSEKKVGLAADEIRPLADAVAAWHWRSPLGICLRRSLLRYHFLREAGLPVKIVFGARLKDSRDGGGIGGHAWLTLNGSPYYENPQDYAGFVEMYTYPVNVERSTLNVKT